ncbi:phytanoyl-CoA dioxygenase family protein [Burkholderia ubonensis]|nr:phytanoyl-CoA dioxygenase family protein [Burkholderia ubonensis]
MLERDGFVSIQYFATPADVRFIDTTLRALLRDGTGFEEGTRRDLVDPDDTLNSNRLTELMLPYHHAPDLHRTEYFAQALNLARFILGPEAEFVFDHAILKPSFHGSETPWHQDEAYHSAENHGRRQIAIWMPTTTATVENGCMRYMPGSHKGGVLTHRPYGGDERVHGLECIGSFDPSQAAYCPLEAGGIAIHDGRTLHGAGSNSTPDERLAYICIFASPTKRVVKSHEFDWLNRRAETAVRRRKRWLWLKGGILFVLARRARRTALRKKVVPR